MAGKVSGFAVVYTAFGGLLIYSGVKGTSLSVTFQDLIHGKLDSTEEASAVEPTGASSTSGSSSAASGTASQNYLTIGQYLASHGYSAAGAAGVVGCIAGESGGNPNAVEAGGGGGGLIQWTPYTSYGIDVTGSETADLDSQLPQIVTYNNNQGANLVALLNAQTDPVSAADFYSQYFERPAVSDSDVVASVAQSVYAELTSSTATSAQYTPAASQTSAEKAASQL